MPAKNTKRLSLDLYPDDLARLQLAATKQKTTFADVLRSLLLSHCRLPTCDEWLDLTGHASDARWQDIDPDPDNPVHELRRYYHREIARFK